MQTLIEKYAKRPVIGDIYTLGNLKTTLDDVLNEYLVSKGHKRSNVYIDAKNAIGILSILISIAVFALNSMYDFAEIKQLLIICILMYFAAFAANSIIKYFEAGMFYYDSFNVATRADNVPVYVVLIYKKGCLVPIKYKKSILDLFDENGRLDHVLFLKDLEMLLKDD